MWETRKFVLKFTEPLFFSVLMLWGQWKTVAVSFQREQCRREGDVDNFPLAFLLSFLLPSVYGLCMSCVFLCNSNSCEMLYHITCTGCSTSSFLCSVPGIESAHLALSWPFIRVGMDWGSYSSHTPTCYCYLSSKVEIHWSARDLKSFTVKILHYEGVCGVPFLGP